MKDTNIQNIANPIMDFVRERNTQDTIYFNFSYSALKLLGKNLYNNAANAISELVANSLDAKANKVYVYIDMSDKKQSTIEILDNGVGMNYSDLAEKYVWIGRNKRTDTDLSADEKQTVMGRKGIGKLAALYLSNRYYIATRKAGEPINYWEVNLSTHKDSDFPRLERMYDELSLTNQDIWGSFLRGTAIKLENVDLRRNGSKKIEGLKRVFSDFYLIDALNAGIFVAVKTQRNQNVSFEPIKKSIAYRNFYALFDNSNFNITKEMAPHIAFKWLSKYEHIANRLRETKLLDTESFTTAGSAFFHKEDGTQIHKEYKLSGWIAIHSTIEQKHALDDRFIRNSVYQPNQLRLFVRNKLAVANYFDMHPSTQTMSNYIEGEISFNILDDDDLPDIATSSRQDFLDDERITLLCELVDPIVNNLFKLRNEIGQKIRSENDEYQEFLVEQERKQKEEQAKARAKAEEDAHLAEEARKEAERLQKRAEDDADRERRRSQYILNVSDVEDKNIMNSVHSIYNMSTRVKENLDEINNIAGFPEAARKKLEKASTSNQRILSVSKIISKAGRVIDNNDAVQMVNLSAFLDEYVKDILSCVYDKNEILIEYTGDITSEFPIKIKPLSFIMMLDNIIGNAIKAMATRLSIIIDTTDINKFSIIFKDNGVGINVSVSNLEKLFDFGVTTTNGSGLGLYYARKLMKELKGSISIAPNNDKGVSVKLSWDR